MPLRPCPFPSFPLPWLRQVQGGLLLVILFSLTGCPGQKAAAPPPAPAEVLVQEVRAEDTPIFNEYVGTIEGMVNANIQARVSGYLISQDYQEGTMLTKGDSLFQIDAKPFEAAVARARANLAQAEASQRQAELTANRSVDLFTRKAVSEQERDNAVQANLAQQAQLQSQRAQLQQAELDLAYTHITSPIPGIAGIARAQVGDLVGPSTGTLTSVSTVDPIKVYFQIAEQRYTQYMARYRDPALRAVHERELQFTLLLANGSTYPEKGEFLAVDREVDPRTGSIRIAAKFPNPGNILRPGQFARVRVQSETITGAIRIPQRAVNELQGIYQVAVVRANNTIEIRPVVAGRRLEAQWLIEKGLQPGERIVVEGFQKVREGQTVAAKPWVPSAAPASPVATTPAQAPPPPAAAKSDTQPAPASSSAPAVR